MKKLMFIFNPRSGKEQIGASSWESWTFSPKPVSISMST